MRHSPVEGWRFQVIDRLNSKPFLSYLVNTVFILLPFYYVAGATQERTVLVMAIPSAGLAWLIALTCRAPFLGLLTLHFTYRYFAARGEEGRAQDRPHFVYGDYQRRRKLPPEALARSVDQAWASSLDPLEGEKKAEAG